MAARTIAGALESRTRGDVLIEVVEDHPELGIDGGRFDEAASGPPDDHTVVEKQRSRIGWADESGLHTRLGKYRELRLNRDVQRFQHRSQIAAAARVKRER